MVNDEVLYETIELIFDELVFPKHAELDRWEMDSESQTLLLWVDTNKVDFTMEDIVDIETYHMLEEEYDHHTSDYFYEILTSEIIHTVNRSLDLINKSYRIDFIFSY